ncbi:MAG: LPS export ABC transporter periplasmic protein LptC [Alphaproteobacteria bacterium]|nr:LPS export ABC transporter periplasmic protein LptC [Alphaproteobacteria bacterium]
MFDSRKIDAYFDDKSSENRRAEYYEPRSFAWRRLIKIALPCVAAALLGLMVVMPNIKKSVDLTDTVTLPRKNEMEQLHIEQTEFNITDSKNRVNKIVADNVDEVETDTARYKIINPKGTIPTDSGNINITSDTGWFDQQKNILELEDNVKAVLDDGTVVRTKAAVYDFNKERGHGNYPVAAKGDWGTMNAESFAYNKVREKLTLKGKHRVETTRGILTGEKETLIFRAENKTITRRNAVITQGERTLRADKIVAYFSDSSKKELVAAEAYGNVYIEGPNEKIRGGEGYYSAQDGKIEMYAVAKNKPQAKELVDVRQNDRTLRAKKIVLYLSKDGKNELERAEAFQDVKIVTPNEMITGGEGYYTAKSGQIELYGTAKNAGTQKGIVEIVQGENVLHARHIKAFLDSKNQIKNAHAFGGVEVITPKGVAWGDRGVYNPAENKVELFDNVRLEQNGNFIVGAHAETDLTTSVSRITGNETTAGRISGTFYKKRK